LEFNQLESFLSVVKHRSFSKAAKELYLTQPTVSNNIQGLEKELNTTLLDRKSKTITLTDSGKIFYNYALELINIREQALHNISNHSNNIEGIIEITVSSIPEQFILPYIIKDFTKIHPKISFSVSTKNSKEIADDILEGRKSYGIVGTKFSSQILKYISFYEDELVLATPDNNDYPMPIDTTLDLDILFKENFVLRTEGSGTRLFLEKCLNNIDISIDDLNVVALIDSNEMIKKMIELGLGVSFVSKISIKNEIALGLIKSFRVRDLDLKRNFYFIYSKNRTLSPIIETFKDFIGKWKGLPV